MIKTERAYESTLKEIEKHKHFIAEQRNHYIKMGLSNEHIEIALQPYFSFTEKLKEDIVEYEEVKKGNFQHVYTFDDLGRLLISFRIFLGWSQTDLAKKLGVAVSQVSRDENHEYYGSSLEKMVKIMKVMDMPASIHFEN